jgi:hypothetical protein
MYLWGLTIDMVACSNLIISVGLCVDFSAHVAHSFMHQRNGSKNDRIVSTLTSIGPAVFNGGISTLIAIIMLVSSESHVFISYFKVLSIYIIIWLSLLLSSVRRVRAVAFKYKLETRNSDRAVHRPCRALVSVDGRMELFSTRPRF